MKAIFAWMALLGAGIASGDEIKIGGARLVFASVEEGRRMLGRRDEFVERMSGFDRAARLKTEKEVSETEFLKFVATQVLEFRENEREWVEESLRRLKPKIEAFPLPWPETIYLIKTTGKEEGNAAYTRANAIVLPERRLSPTRNPGLDRILAHELFHILSRQNPALKEALYEVIGFRKCEEIPFPKGRARITNPDAPRNDHWIELQAEGKTVAAIPILLASQDTYDPRQGGEFFNYLTFKFLVVQPNEDRTASVIFDAENPTLLDADQVDGFFEQVGRNTNYIIHPEEILADNFALLIDPKGEVKTPELLQKMQAKLEEFGR